ncbi:Protein TOXD [Ceratocystis platani]|uniref:Protein TOXD n=1 Tax=Ceratocystis fimbriata f. sp. platani TaxID=88771 RepID=A0A0F8DGH9_CERFI|nr:Protein TOXD [Ceratocystis platani]
MSSNRVITVTANAKAEILDVAVPELPGPDYILVKVTAVALNPTDWKHIDQADFFGCVGANLGCDYAGIVEKVGSGVTKEFKKGDRISGPVNGGNGLSHVNGSFGNYIVVKGDLQIKTPDNISDEQAATLGIAVTTATLANAFFSLLCSQGQGLYQKLGLPLPSPTSSSTGTILIYGGSGAMGNMGIQFAKLSGFEVITTCSPRNFDLVKALGADHVFDYNDAGSAAAIRQLTNNKLAYAWDTISKPETGRFCAEALSTEGGKYSSLLPGVEDAIKEVNPKVQVDMSVFYAAFGEPFKLVAEVPADMENYEFAKKIWSLAAGWLSEGKLKPSKVDLNRGGKSFEGIFVGLDYLKNGNVSGSKLVYTI